MAKKWTSPPDDETIDEWARMQASFIREYGKNDPRVARSYREFISKIPAEKMGRFRTVVRGLSEDIVK